MISYVSRNKTEKNFNIFWTDDVPPQSPCYGPMKSHFRILFALLLWLIFFCLTFLKDYNIDQINYCGDQSELIETALRITQGVAIYRGPPSQGGSHNIGPLYYYYLALLLVFSGKSIVIMNLLNCLVQSCGFLFLCLLLLRLTGSYFLSFACAISMYAHSQPYYYMKIVWGPAVVMPAFIASLFLLQLIQDGRHGFIPLLAFLQAFQIQAHYAMIFPCAGILFALILHLVRLHRETLPLLKKTIIISMLAFSLPFIFTLYDLVLNYGENAKRLVQFHFAHGGSVRWSEIILFLAEFAIESSLTPWFSTILASMILLASFALVKKKLNFRFEFFLPLSFSILSLFFIRDRIDNHYLAYFAFFPPILFAILGNDIQELSNQKARPFIRISIAILVLSAAFSDFRFNFESHAETSWNSCPYGEMRKLSLILKKNAGANPVYMEIIGSNAPPVMASFARLFHALSIEYSPTAAKYKIFTPPDGLPDNKYETLYVSTKFRLQRIRQ